MKIINEHDINIHVGENAEENWNLLDMNSEYLWFHLKSFPSCHVVVENINPSSDVIQYAASICKSHTKYRNLKNLKINYTPLKNVRKAENVGSVCFISNRKVNTITI